MASLLAVPPSSTETESATLASLKPAIVAIAGPSGSGKSYLSHALAHRLPGEVGILSIDSYYRDLPHLSYAQRCEINFDHPDSIDDQLLTTQLEALLAGHAIEKPVYDFATHLRAPEPEPFAPAPILVLEGIFALYFPRVREIAAVKVYVQTPDEECYGRRLERDTHERGRTPDSVAHQYQATVLPMAAEFVWPTRRFADLEVSGTQPVELAVDAILKLLSAASPPPR